MGFSFLYPMIFKIIILSFLEVTSELYVSQQIFFIRINFLEHASHSVYIYIYIQTCFFKKMCNVFRNGL